MKIQKVHLAIIYQNVVLQLKNCISPTTQASFSIVLTLAKLINQNFPKIMPPQFDPEYHLNLQAGLEIGILDKKNSSVRDNNYPDKLFQPWCDYLAQIIRKGSAFIHQQSAYFLIETKKQQYLESFKQTDSKNLFIQKKIENQLIMKEFIELITLKKFEIIFNISLLNVNNLKRKIAIINFSKSALRTDPYHPKVNIQGLIEGIWFNNQQWFSYKILKGQIPSQQELKQFDVVILSGSALSVNDNHPNVQTFLGNLKKATQINLKLKILGICFGHQAIAKMFNGKVQKGKWIGGIQNVNLKISEIQIDKQHSFLKDVKNFKQPVFKVSEFHSDAVIQIPNNFKVIASSKSCLVESLVSQNGRILSFQFHPQYISTFVKSYQTRILIYNGKTFFGDFEHQEQYDQRHKQSVLAWRKTITNFLNQI